MVHVTKGGARPRKQTKVERDRQAYYACLLDLRERADRAGRRREVALIDATLGDDLWGQLRARVGSVSLSPRQWDALLLIDELTQQHGYAPTLQELGDAMGLSKVAAYEHVLALKRRGVLWHGSYQARSLRILASHERPAVMGSPLPPHPWPSRSRRAAMPRAGA